MEQRWNVMSYFDVGVTKISNEKNAFDLAILNFNANDCENAPKFRQFQDVRNVKSKIDENYNSETTASETNQELVTKKKTWRIKQKLIQEWERKIIVVQIPGSETEEDSFKKGEIIKEEVKLEYEKKQMEE